MIADTLSDAVKYIEESLEDGIVTYPDWLTKRIKATVEAMEDTRVVLDHFAVHGVEGTAEPPAQRGTRYVLHDGPCDGLEIYLRDVPHTVEMLVLCDGVKTEAYVHNGQPGEVDCLAPIAGSSLDWIPEGPTDQKASAT